MILNYLLLEVYDYKGGEQGTPKICDSIVECLFEIHDDAPDNVNEWKEAWLEKLENRPSYAGGVACFNIYRRYERKLVEVSEAAIESVINSLTQEQYDAAIHTEPFGKLKK